MPADDQTATHGRTTHGTAVGVDVAKIMEMPMHSVHAAFTTQQAALRSATRVGEELMGFASRRLDTNRCVFEEMKACQTPGEAVGVCSQYWLNASHQYAEEWSRLAAAVIDEMRRAAEDGRAEARTGPNGANSKVKRAGPRRSNSSV